MLTYEMQELGSKGFTAESLVSHMKAVLDKDVPVDEIRILLAFLTVQKCLQPVGRDGKKFRPAKATLFNDSMEEYHLLRLRGQPG